MYGGSAAACVHTQGRGLRMLSIPWDSLALGDKPKILGRGGFGSVYKGRWRVRGRVYERLNMLARACMQIAPSCCTRMLLPTAR